MGNKRKKIQSSLKILLRKSFLLQQQGIYQEKIMIMARDESAALTSELKNGMNVINSLLDDLYNHTVSSSLTPYQRSGLYELRKTIISTTNVLNNQENLKQEDESTTSPAIPKELYNEKDDCTS